MSRWPARLKRSVARLLRRSSNRRRCLQLLASQRVLRSLSSRSVNAKPHRLVRRTPPGQKLAVLLLDGLPGPRLRSFQQFETLRSEFESHGILVREFSVPAGSSDQGQADKPTELLK